MNKQTLKTILSKLNDEEQQQIICLAEIDDLLIDFVHKVEDIAGVVIEQNR